MLFLQRVELIEREKRYTVQTPKCDWLLLKPSSGAKKETIKRLYNLGLY